MNSHGFKSQSFNMVENKSQTIKQGASPTEDLGGTNPIQIGYGVKAGSVATDFSQGTLESTDRTLDMAIQGEGFFVLKDSAGAKNFSRVGNFALDSQGYLVDQGTGYRVQSSQGNILIEQGAPLNPKATSEVSIQGNLDSSTLFPGGTTLSTNIQVLDTRGQEHTVAFTLEKTADLVWKMTASLPDADGVLSDNLVEGITFNENGSFAGVTGTGTGNNKIIATFQGLTTPQEITFDLGTIGSFDGLTHLGGDSTASAIEQNGYTTGSLISLSVNPDGTVVGGYSNGQKKNLAELQIATFANPEGLEKTENNMYVESPNSGQAILGKALGGRAGSVLSGKLEASNVDLTKEMALMIVAQRGFQVNARVVTVSNEILQEVAGLVR